MDKLMENLEKEGTCQAEEQRRKYFFTELAKDATPEGTLEALLNQTMQLNQMHDVLHVCWDYGQFELIRAVGYTLVNSSLSKRQRYRLVEALAYWERFFIRMNLHKGLLKEMRHYHNVREKELRKLLSPGTPGVKEIQGL